MPSLQRPSDAGGATELRLPPLKERAPPAPPEPRAPARSGSIHKQPRGKRKLGGLVTDLETGPSNVPPQPISVAKPPAALSSPAVATRPPGSLTLKAPPRALPLWVDGSLTLHDPSAPTAVEDIAAARAPTSPRVCAMLCRDLRCGTVQRQLRCLQHLLHSFGALERVTVTAGDAEQLLTMLFLFMQRRGARAMTQWQATLQTRVAELAFRCLYSLFRRPSRHTTTLRRGLVLLLDAVDRGRDYYLRRPELPPPPPPPPDLSRGCSFAPSDASMRKRPPVAPPTSPKVPGSPIPVEQSPSASLRDDEWEPPATDEIEFAPASAAHIMKAPPAELNWRMGRATKRLSSLDRPPAPPPEDEIPWLQTLDCISPRLLGPDRGALRGPLGDLTEERWMCIETDFYANECCSPEGTFQLKDVRPEEPFMVMGVDISLPTVFAVMDPDADGYISLGDIVHFLYPCVPWRFVRRRAKISEAKRAVEVAAAEAAAAAAREEAAAAAGTPAEENISGGDARLSVSEPTPIKPSGAGRPPHEPEEGEEEDDRWGVVLVCDDWHQAIRRRQDSEAAALITAESDLSPPAEDPGDAGDESYDGGTGIPPPPSDDGSSSEPSDEEEEEEEEGKNEDTAPPEEPEQQEDPEIKLAREHAERAGLPMWSADTACLLKDSFGALDRGFGAISHEELEISGGLLGGLPVPASVFDSVEPPAEGVPPSLDFFSLCTALYPHTPEEQIREGVAHAEREEARKRKEREEAMRKNEIDFLVAAKERKLEKQAEREAIEAELATIRARMESLERRVSEDLPQAVPTVRSKRRKEGDALGPCVPVVLTCEPAPKTVTISGLRLSPDCFSLDCFLADPSTRAAAAQLLAVLDAMEIDARAFTSRPHLYLPVRTAEPHRVYRDFASFNSTAPRTLQCGQQNTRWILFRTNIRRRSNIRFRFHFEGHNAVPCRDKAMLRRQSVNTMVCGATGFPSWPDSAEHLFSCFDAEYSGQSVCHLAKGLSSATVGYTEKEELEVRLGAPSWSDLAISCSAWLVFHDWGPAHDLVGTFVLED
eukprot:TRINITY_DN2206_c1_g1_i1.p1 TRINITY_DN2206_c1_g1~~TRINITY_DN2206_c1_g1_i1.p1  ORF type:complete len:1072 (+),score=280.94 TRINITY_DN2206_c1_g1_i1:72-3218(+)